MNIDDTVRLIDTAKATRQELIHASTELAALKEEMFKPGDIDLTQHSIAGVTAALERVNELKRRLEGELEELGEIIVELPGGLKFSRLECLMMEESEELDFRFRGIDIQGDLSALAGCSKLRDLNVVGNHNLTSLHGVPLASIEKITASYCNLQGGLSALSGCAKLRELDVDNNHNLNSLHGVPLASIEEINAAECNLQGDLSALAGCAKLRVLDISRNGGYALTPKGLMRSVGNLTSLDGVPLASIEKICARLCNLQGDLSALADCAKLKELDVGLNRNLTSLRGVPLASIEMIDADECDLQGDLSALAGCAKLKVLSVESNPSLTSLHGVPLASIEKIEAYSCNLQGDLSALSDCAKLKELKVRYNPNLTSLHGVPLASIETIDAQNCNLQGDHSFLADAPNLKYLDIRGNPSLTLDTSKFRKEVVIYW